MKQLAILSGKGGTGKTTVAASFIAIAQNRAYADCDVDAPNLQLIYDMYNKPEISEFYGYKKAVKYENLCSNCGKCIELCQFGAIRDGKVNAYECEGCGVCEAFCPSTDEDGKKAIRLENNVSGHTMLYKKDDEVFSTAELKMGNGASGKLVTQVRKNLYNTITRQELIIIDGSPGIGCPVIASVTGVDMVLVVTEPTLSGMHDMKRIIETTVKFGAVCFVCINKYDINLVITQMIEEYCAKFGIQVAGRIPFDHQVVEAVNAGKPIVSIDNSSAKDAIIKIWDVVSSELMNDLR